MDWSLSRSARPGTTVLSHTSSMRPVPYGPPAAISRVDSTVPLPAPRVPGQSVVFHPDAGEVGGERAEVAERAGLEVTHDQVGEVAVLAGGDRERRADDAAVHQRAGHRLGDDDVLGLGVLDVAVGRRRAAGRVGAGRRGGVGHRRARRRRAARGRGWSCGRVRWWPDHCCCRGCGPGPTSRRRGAARWSSTWWCWPASGCRRGR